jgi:hypothetical protein
MTLNHRIITVMGAIIRQRNPLSGAEIEIKRNENGSARIK